MLTTHFACSGSGSNPFPVSLAAGASVTLAFDDEGISCVDLSHKDQLAVLRLKESDRARTQWQLEADFAEFEALPWLH